MASRDDSRGPASLAEPSLHTGPEVAKALAGLRVLELGGGIDVPFAARLLADLGAEVVKVEPSGGDPARRAEPLVPGADGERESLLFSFLNWSKKSVVLDLESEEDRPTIEELVAGADIIMENLPPGRLGQLGLGYEQLSAWNPRVVLTSVSPFGQEGELASWQATDLILYATSGVASISGNKYPHAPLKHGLQQSPYQVGLNAAYVSLAAYRLARYTGRGEHVDLAGRDCLTSELVAQTGYYVFTGAVFGRHPVGNDPFRGDPVTTGNGYFCMQAGRAAPIGGYAEFFDLPQLLTDDYSTASARLRHAAEVRQLIEERLRGVDPVELFEEACRRGLLVGVVNEAHQLLENKHLAARDIWRTLPADDGEEPAQWRYPFEMARFSETPVTITGRPPRLGEHTAEARAGRYGRKPGERPVVAETSGTRLPLEGLRVIDLSAVVAGPYMAAMLSDFGAEVIKIEGPQKLDQTRGTAYGSFIDNDPAEEPWNRGSTYHILNRGKRSFVCDLSTEAGRELLRRLLKSADILVENFTPRVLRGWGLSPAALAELNPRLITISNSGYGATGPWSSFRAQGTSLEVTTGISAYTGYRGGSPSKAGQSYPDFNACWYGLTAVLAALIYRDRTGRGQAIDQGMLQVGAALIPEALLHFQVHGQELPRIGAEDMTSLFSGVFETSEHDRWLAVSVRDEADLERLAEVVPLAEDDPDGAGREASVLAALRDFAAARTAAEAAGLLQGAGVPAGPVLDIEELLFDRHLMRRGFYERLDYGEQVGARPVIGRPFRFLTSEPSGPHVSRRAPDYGADNDYVLQDILQLSADESARLYREGVVVNVPTGRVQRKPWDIEALGRDGPLDRFDPAVRRRMAERNAIADKIDQQK